MSRKDQIIKQAWHGIPREEINWHPTIEKELCTGCGICMLGCGKQVYEFDYEKNVPIVADPQNCKVGCMRARERIYKQMATSAYKDREFFDIRRNPYSVLPDGLTIYLGMGLCKSEAEEVISYERFREAIKNIVFYNLVTAHKFKGTYLNIRSS